jgi:hypothetical protein
MRRGESYVVNMRHNGFVYYAGMITKDVEPGFWEWSCYASEYQGIATSRREARSFILQQAREDLESGRYEMQYNKDNPRCT